MLNTDKRTSLLLWSSSVDKTFYKLLYKGQCYRTFHLGRLLALPANIRLGRKGLPGTNTLAYLAQLVNYNCNFLYKSCPLLYHLQPDICLFESGNPFWGGRLSTVDLLIKVACFVIKINNIFNLKTRRSTRVRTRRSTVLSLPPP